jgi:hypothetical protein
MYNIQTYLLCLQNDCLKWLFKMLGLRNLQWCTIDQPAGLKDELIMRIGHMADMFVLVTVVLR